MGNNSMVLSKRYRNYRKKVGIKGPPRRSDLSDEKQKSIAKAEEFRKTPNPGPLGMFRGGPGNIQKPSIFKPPTWQGFLQNMPGEFKEQFTKGLKGQSPDQQKKTWEQMKFQVEYGEGDGESEELKWNKSKYEQDLRRKAPPYFDKPGGYDPGPPRKRLPASSKKVKQSKKWT